MFRRVLRTHPFNLALIATAIFALALTYLGSPLSLLIWVVAFLGAGIVVASYLFGRRRTGSIRGTTPALLILTFAAVSPLVFSDVENEVAAWTGVGIASFAIASLGMVETIANYAGAQAINVPGISTMKTSRGVKLAAQIAIVAMPAVFFAFARFRLDGWIWLGAAALLSLVTLLVYVMAAIRQQRSRQARADLPGAVAALEPEFVLYWDSFRGTGYQINMWIPYLRRLDKPFFVIVRNRQTWAEASRIVGDDIPAVLAPRIRDVDDLVVPTLRAAFYTNNAARNSHLVRFHRLKHIQLLHGESDKASSYNPVTGMFTKIYVAGRAGRDRYANNGVQIDPDKFEIVGRPQVESIVLAKPQPQVPERRTVLYAPTWRGSFADSSYSSLGFAEQLVTELIERDCAIIFRPHRLSYHDPVFRAVNTRIKKTLFDHREVTGVAHILGQGAEVDLTLNECFNASDAMISDVSSVVGDWLYSLKPLVTTAIGRTPEEFTAEFPLAEAGYIITEDPTTWQSAFDAMLGDDPKRARRAELRDYYLGTFPADDYASGFILQARSDIESTPAIGSHGSPVQGSAVR